MSSIDERVVRMEFDNKQFESGVSETMSSLQKLKMALKLRNSKEGMQDLQKAANNLNLGTINDQIYQVQEHFSFFGEFVRNVFDRISNKVIDLGSTMVRELTTQPLKAGFSEYELQMDSTQTIMASTGASIDEVNGYLDELNTYADKTIYSFSDMTSSIGKFTNAGVSLDDAVKAIQGISNEAAVSGANANEASRAMYNFAQALSAGSVKLIDWKSIENANMATVEFKDELINTAVALGTLKKDGDEYVSTTKDMQGKVSAAFTATKGFNESLSAQWMTTDVLIETMSHYSTDVREMSKAEKDAYEERLKSLGFNAEQIKNIEELGQKAFDSAQDVKTFSQLVDTVKESLGSGWTKSFQLMVGNLEEAKVLWTGVNKEINAILDPIAEAREQMLLFWHDNGGRKAAIRSVSNAWEGLKSIMGAVSTAYRSVFPPMTGERLVEITKRLRKLTAGFKEFAKSNQTVDYIRKIFTGLFSSFKLFLTLAQRIALHFSPVIKIFGNFASTLLRVSSMLGVFVERLSNASSTTEGFKDNFFIVKNAASVLVKGIEDLIKALLDLVGIHIEGNPLSAIFDALAGFASTHMDFSFFNALGSAGDLAARAVAGLGKALSGVLNFSFGGLSSLVGKITGAFGELGQGTKQATEGVEPLTSRILPVAQSGLSKFIEFIVGAGKKIGKFAINIGESIPKAFEYLGSSEFHNLVANVNGILTGGLLVSLQKFVKSYTKKDGSIDAGGLFGGIKDAISGIKEKVNGTFDGLSDALNRFQETVKSDSLVKIAIAVGVLAGSIALLGTLDAEKTATGLAAIAGCLGMLTASLKTLDTGGGLAAAFALSQLGSSMIKMAVAVGIMALSIKAMQDVNMDQLEVAFTGIIGLLGALVVGVSALTKFGGDISKSSKGLLTLAAAVGVLTLAVKALSTLNMDQLTTGLEGVGILLGEIAVFSQWSSSDTFSVRSAIGILSLAVALKILQGVVTVFAALKGRKMTQGLEGVLALLLSISLFSRTLDTGGMSLRAAVAVLTTVAAIKVLEGVVSTFASLKPKQMTRGLEGVFGLLVGISLFATMLGNSGLTLKAAVSVGILALAISGLSSVVTSFGGMSSDQLGSAIDGLAKSMIILVGALMVLGAGSPMMLVGAASLLAVAVAIWAIVPAIQELSKVKATSIIKAVGGITLALVGLSLGLAVLGVISPLALAAALALAALGAAAGYLGTGLTTLAAGLAAFAGSMAAIGAGIVANVSTIAAGIGALIVTVLTGIGEAIIGFIESIANGIDRILAAVGVIIHAVGNFIIENIPYILMVVGTLISSVLSLGIQFIPQIVTLIGLFVAAILTSITTFIPTIAAALINAVVVLANSLANGIRENSGEILAAVRNVLSSILELVLTAISELLRMIPGVGDFLADQLENARGAVQQTLAPETIESYTTDAMGGAISGIEKGGNEMATAAGEASQSAKDSMSENLTGGEEISSSFMSEIISGFTDANGEFSNIGTENFSAYISNFKDDASAGEAGATINSTILESLNANSESFAAAGEEDIAKYLASFDTGTAEKKGSIVASSAASGAGSVTSKFSGSGKKDVQAFIRAITSGNASKAGKDLGSSGASGAGSTKSAYEGAGTNVAGGFNWGVASPAAMAAANAAGRRLGGEALRGIKIATAVKSPSREAMKIGRYIGEGLSIGIDAMSKVVYDESVGIGQQSLNGIRDSLSAVSKYIDADMDIDPTIRPVMDLTDIQNGMGQINGMFSRANDSLLVGFSNSDFANRAIGSMLNGSVNSLSTGALANAKEQTGNVYNINVSLQYDASADANELARGFARAVQPYVTRGSGNGR